jgi:hypothetical protein
VVDELSEDVSSLQPNQPGVSHVVDVKVVRGTVVRGAVLGGTVVRCVEGGVDVSEGEITVGLVDVISVVTVLSLQPNQPGVSHVVVAVVLVVVGVSVLVAVVVSSKQPHHPGVSQAAVLVCVVFVVVEDDEVIGSVPLLSYIFQLAQSRHSGVPWHNGTESYFIITSWITDRILCVPTPTRQPLSATTSYTHSTPVWQADSSA